MNQNYLHVVNMTDDEKREMYGSLKKEELIEMIIARERADELVLYGVSGGTTIPEYKPLNKTTFSATIKNFAFDDDPEIRAFVNEHFDELWEIEEK